MAYSPTGIQRRIIAQLVRKNTRGWGRPLEYTLQRLRLAGLFGAVAIGVGVIDVAVNGVARALNWGTGSGVFLGVIFLFSAVFALGLLYSSLPVYLRAAEQPQVVKGKVDAVICDTESIAPFLHNTYHFITVRLTDGKLRPFALAAEMHDQACQVGQQVTLTVQPGTERVLTITRG